MIDCKGINMAPTIPTKKSAENFERNFERAKPAIVLTVRIIRIAPRQTTVELRSCRPTGIAVKSFLQEASECPAVPKNCSFDLKEVFIMKING